MTGGPGWPHTIQNAIMHLDNRLDSLKTVLVSHQQALQNLQNEHKDAILIVPNKENNELN